MDTKRQKHIAIIVLVTALILIGILFLSQRPTTSDERRVDRIERQIDSIRAEIEALEESDMDDEEKATLAAELSRRLLEAERELRDLLNE